MPSPKRRVSTNPQPQEKVRQEEPGQDAGVHTLQPWHTDARGTADWQNPREDAQDTAVTDHGPRRPQLPAACAQVSAAPQHPGQGAQVLAHRPASLLPHTGPPGGKAAGPLGSSDSMRPWTHSEDSRPRQARDSLVTGEGGRGAGSGPRQAPTQPQAAPEGQARGWVLAESWAAVHTTLTLPCTRSTDWVRVRGRQMAASASDPCQPHTGPGWAQLLPASSSWHRPGQCPQQWALPHPETKGTPCAPDSGWQPHVSCPHFRQASEPAWGRTALRRLGASARRASPPRSSGRPTSCRRPLSQEPPGAGLGCTSPPRQARGQCWPWSHRTFPHQHCEPWTLRGPRAALWAPGQGPPAKGGRVPAAGPAPRSPQLCWLCLALALPALPAGGRPCSR